MIRIPFTKMTGAGNDFVVIDNRKNVIHGDIEAFTLRVCDRRFGVGADGLLLLQPSKQADFQMRYLNADGSTGSMCGNGGRCIARFAHQLGIVTGEMQFEAAGHIYKAKLLNETVRLHMKDPTEIQPLTLSVEGEQWQGYWVDTGAPHVVVFTDEMGTPIQELDLGHWGPKLRRHERFAPAGTNVDFVQTLSNNSLRMRTFERGVEAETLACGTGAVAAALVSAAFKALVSPVVVTAQSGRRLVINFRGSQRKYSDVTLEGDAQTTFTGELNIDDETSRVE